MPAKFVRTLAFAAAVTALAGTAAAFDRDKALTLPAEGIRTLQVESGAGFLKVRGEEGLAEIRVDARIVADGIRDADREEWLADHVRLELVRRGDRAVLTATIRERGFLIGEDRRIDLTVRMPRALELAVDDGSGPVDISDVGGDVRVDDGSGELRVERLGGGLRIDDGSGDVFVSDVAGDLFLDDGSGDVEITGVRGDVEVDDGSGELVIRTIGGTVVVDDGSGDIVIDGVKKDVELRRTGSGDVDVDHVDGRVIR